MAAAPTDIPPAKARGRSQVGEPRAAAESQAANKAPHSAVARPSPSHGWNTSPTPAPSSNPWWATAPRQARTWKGRRIVAEPYPVAVKRSSTVFGPGGQNEGYEHGRGATGPRRGGRAGRRGGHRAGQAVAGDRVERSHQPHVVRDVRVPEAVRLQPPQGDQAHAGRPPQGQGHRVVGEQGEGRVRRVPSPRPRAVGHHAAGLSLRVRTLR